MVTTVFALPEPQRETSVIQLQSTIPERVRYDVPNIFSLVRDFLQGFWLYSTTTPILSSSKVGSESIVIAIEVLIDWLARQVHVRSPDAIREYLSKFPDIMDVIPQAIGAARKYFPGAQIVIDVYQDPEIDDQYLILYIRLRHYDDSFMERLENAEAEFLNQLVGKSGWIQLTTDYREPEGKDAL